MENRSYLKPYHHLVLLLLVLAALPHKLSGQYVVEGRCPSLAATHHVYFSILERWDDFNAISTEMIIKGARLDSTGYFRFEGNEISARQGFYRIHFAPKTSTAVALNSLPENRKHIHFLLTNSDSIYFDISDHRFITKFLTIESTIPLNTDVMKVERKLDSLYHIESNAQSQTHERMMSEKKMALVQQTFDRGGNAMIQLLAIATANLPFEGHEDLYRQLLEDLAEGDYQKSYLQTFKSFVGSKDYSRMRVRNRWLKWVLLLSVLLNLLFIARWLRQSNKKRKTESTLPNLSLLTSKEQQVLGLIATHKTNKEIGAELFISDATVKTHINNIYRKTGVKSRKAAISYWQTQKSTPV